MTNARTANIVLAIGGLNGFVSTEVLNSTFVLRMSVSAKKPAHRQYAARLATPYQRLHLKSSQNNFQNFTNK